MVPWVAPTVSIVEELCDVQGAAGGPRPSLIEVNEQRGHHVVIPQGPEQLLTVLRVIMRHAEHVTFGEENRTVCHVSNCIAQALYIHFYYNGMALIAFIGQSSPSWEGSDCIS